MLTPTRHDRRRTLRGFVSLPVSLTIGELNVPWTAETIDLSEGGALVRTNARLAPGTPARLRFAFEDSEFRTRVYEAEGAIGRAHDDDVVSVVFAAVSDDLRVFARTLVGRA